VEFRLKTVEIRCRLTVELKLYPRLWLGDGQGKGVQNYFLLWSGHSVRLNTS